MAFTRQFLTKTVQGPFQFFFQGKANELSKVFLKSSPDEKGRALDLLTKLDISNINLYKQDLQ